VDIVIDEDIPPAEETALQHSPETEEPLEKVEPADEEEASELTLSVDEEESPLDASEGDKKSEEETLIAEDADSQRPPTQQEFVPGIAATQVADFEDLDTLPDIDTFSPSTEASEPPTRPSKQDSKVEEVVRDQDPENLARAVRTFMKKDQ
jgi:hypothetical protein